MPTHVQHVCVASPPRQAALASPPRTLSVWSCDCVSHFFALHAMCLSLFCVLRFVPFTLYVSVPPGWATLDETRADVLQRTMNRIHSNLSNNHPIFPEFHSGFQANSAQF